MERVCSGDRDLRRIVGMPKNPIELRQGDVFLVRVPNKQTVPTTTTIQPEEKRTILAHGEVTGHAHALPAEDVELYDIDPAFFQGQDAAKLQAANTRLLRVLRPTSLKHEEHAPIPLDPGDYLISIQLDFDEDAEWGRVAD